MFTGVCGLGLHIYVAGGFDSSTQLNTVERYVHTIN